MFLYWFLGSFIRQLRQHRLLLISGPVGTGKTLLAVALSHYFLTNRYVSRVSAPFPLYWNSAPSPFSTFCILDEGGRVFDSRNFADKQLSRSLNDATVFLRKTGSYLVTSSFTDTDKRLRAGLRCRRISALAARAWVYRWETGTEEVSERTIDDSYRTGLFFLLNPSAFFGTYDTLYPSSIEQVQTLLRSFLAPF